MQGKVQETIRPKKKKTKKKVIFSRARPCLSTRCSRAAGGMQQGNTRKTDRDTDTDKARYIQSAETDGEQRTGLLKLVWANRLNGIRARRSIERGLIPITGA